MQHLRNQGQLCELPDLWARAQRMKKTKPGQLWLKHSALPKDLWLHRSINTAQGTVIPEASATCITAQQYFGNSEKHQECSSPALSASLILWNVEQIISLALLQLILEIIVPESFKILHGFQKDVLALSHYLTCPSREPSDYHCCCYSTAPII